MKLKNYYMEASSEAMKVIEQPKQRKVKYHSKTKGYSEDQDFLYYNNFTDEKDSLDVTNYRYTVSTEKFG